MHFKTGSDFLGFLKAKTKLCKVSDGRLTLNEISALLGEHIPHEMHSDFDVHPEKYSGDYNFQCLKRWRGLFEYCYRTIDGDENPNALTEWMQLLLLASKQSSQWTDSFLDFLIQEYESENYHGLKIRTKNIQTVLFLSESIGLTAEHLSQLGTAPATFNDQFLQQLAMLFEQLGEKAEAALEYLFSRTINLLTLFEIPSDTFLWKEANFLTTLCVLENHPEILDALKMPVLLKMDSKLPDNLRAFEKVSHEDNVQSVNTIDVLSLLHELQKADKLDSVISLIEKGELSLSILYRQFLVLKDKENEKNTEPFFSWLSDWSDMCAYQTFSAIPDLVATGFSMRFQRMAEYKYWLQKEMQQGNSNNLHLDFSAGRLTLDNAFWDFLLNEYLPTCPKTLLTLDFRGQYISEAHFYALTGKLRFFKHIDTIHVSEQFDKAREFKPNIAYKVIRENEDTSLYSTYEVYTLSLNVLEKRISKTELNAELHESFKLNEQGETLFEFEPGKTLAKKDNWTLDEFELLFAYFKQNNPVITSIRFFGVSFDDASFSGLLACLPFLTELKSLRISQSTLSEDNKRALEEFIPLSKSLQHFESSYVKKDERDFYLSNEIFHDLRLSLDDEKTDVEEKSKYFEVWLRNIDVLKRQYEKSDSVEFSLDFTEKYFKVDTEECYDAMQAKLTELYMPKKSTTVVTQLTCDFSRFSPKFFKQFMENFVTQFGEITELTIDGLSTFTHAEQTLLINKLSLLPKLSRVFLDSPKFTAKIYQKLFDVIKEKDEKRKQNLENDSSLDIPEFMLYLPDFDEEDFDGSIGFEPSEEYRALYNNENRRAIIANYQLKEQIKNAKINAEKLAGSRDSTRSDTSNESNAEENARKKTQKKVKFTDAFSKETVLIKNETIASALITHQDAYREWTLQKNETTGELLYPWASDARFASKDTQMILNGLLLNLGSRDETAEVRLAFYHRFGLLPALVDYVKTGFKNQTLTWDSLKALDTVATFENDDQFYYTKENEISEASVYGASLTSVPRQLPRLLAGCQRDRVLTVDEIVEFDLYDNNPRHNPTFTRELSWERFYSHALSYLNFNNEFFDTVITPIAKQRVLLYQELTKLDNITPISQQQKKEKALLIEKIDLLSGFIKKQSAALKQHELIAATSMVGGPLSTNKFSAQSMPLFRDNWYKEKDTFFSDDTYRLEMAGTVTCDDLNKNRATQKKDLSNESRHYGKDLCRKILGAFVVAVTFPISLPVLYFSEKAYGALFQTKTKSMLSMATNKGKNLTENEFVSTDWKQSRIPKKYPVRRP